MQGFTVYNAIILQLAAWKTNLTPWNMMFQNRLLGFVALPYQNIKIYFRFL